MTVYVDDASIQADVPNAGRTISSRWSHLMADSLEELIAFATGPLGLRLAWLQDKKSGVHFDVTAGKRWQAIRLGAVPIEAPSPQGMDVVAAARRQWSGYVEGDE